jgi:UDP-glucose 4-epimerase
LTTNGNARNSRQGKCFAEIEKSCTHNGRPQGAHHYLACRKSLNEQVFWLTTKIEVEGLVFNSILVTGGYGFIGANLVRKLLSDGARVCVLDDLSRGDATNLEGLTIDRVIGDVRDPRAVSEALDAGVEAVVHMAAFGSVTESVTALGENFDVNVRGTVNLLQEATRRKVKKFIFASSGGAVIGRAPLPVNEDSLPRPVSPYGASKLCGEAYCHAFARTFGLPTVMLRFANVYGPFSHHKRSAVTSFIKALLGDRPIVIYGDGSATRDFLFVDDLCQGICQALSLALEPGTLLHLATGVETSIIALANELKTIAGLASHPIRFAERRAAELAHNFADFSHARQLLGFTPRTPLKAGLKLTWDWFCSRANVRSLLDEN